MNNCGNKHSLAAESIANCYQGQPCIRNNTLPLLEAFINHTYPGENWNLIPFEIINNMYTGLLCSNSGSIVVRKNMQTPFSVAHN